MKNTDFDQLALRLEEKIYRSEKGMIRLTLLEEDLRDYWPSFCGQKSLSILDAGGGAGHFSRICAAKGHRVILCDISAAMLKLAEERNRRVPVSGKIILQQRSFTHPDLAASGPYDMVALHGVAGWTEDPVRTIRNAAELVKPGGVFSLLVYNKDKLVLKKGINGQLDGTPVFSGISRRLAPPNGLSSSGTEALLNDMNGTILLQSGIRIFQGFFTQWKPPDISREQWLAQERQYYRTPPFNSLGEHTHFIWQKCRSESEKL